MDIQQADIELSDKRIIELHFSGRLDGVCQSDVRQVLHRALNDAPVVLANLEDITFMDSSGLSALVSGLRVARERNKDIILVNLPEQTQVIFQLTMMDQIFSIFTSRQAALDALT